MAKYYMTVGVQYAHEPHPQGLHPDGWVEIEAENEAEARIRAFDLFKDRWSFIYPESEFDSSYHPLGCQGRIGGDADCEALPVGPE